MGKGNSVLVCIYVLIDPRDMQIFYVGQTSSELKVRLGMHISEARSFAKEKVQTVSQQKRAFVREILAAGEQPIILSVEFVDHSISTDRETFWRRALTQVGCRLLQDDIIRNVRNRYSSFFDKIS